MRNRNLGLVIACGLLAIVACGGDDSDNGERSDEQSDEEQDTGQPPGWKVIEESPEQSLTLNEEPLWGSDTEGPMDLVISAELHDDSAILIGARSDDSSILDRIDVVDATSGQRRWSISNGDDIPGGNGAEVFLSTPFDRATTSRIVEPAEGEWAVLVQYQLELEAPPSARYEYGVAALSGENGEVMWKAPVVVQPDPDREDQLEWRTLEANDELAVAVIQSTAPGCQHDTECLQSIAIDTSDGSVLAESTDTLAGDLTTPAALPANGLMLTQVPNEDAGGEDEPMELFPNTTVVALDATTGEEQWNLSERASRSYVRLVAGDVALVEVLANDDSPEWMLADETIVVDVSTGEEVTSLGTSARDCISDGETLLACTMARPEDVMGPRHLATFVVEDGDSGVSARTIPTDRIQRTHQGFVVLGGSDELDDDSSEASEGVVVDRAGSEVDLGVPGTVLAMSDRYAVVADQPLPGEDGQPLPSPYAVHEVTIG